MGVSTSIVIFGASGDLTSRKLLPALYHLTLKKRLSADSQIIGFARRPYSHEEFRRLMREAVAKAQGAAFDLGLWDEFAARIWYVQGDLDTEEDFGALDSFLNERETDDANRLYYLATAPSYYDPVLLHLAAHDMTTEQGGWRRVVIEKPFGVDSLSAAALNRVVHGAFQEHQVYRIDHYLGKETVQNICYFRFANTILEPVWNRNYIDHVQITVAESVDVEHRGGYYDTAGVLRDMFQNHLLQLLTLTAMEPPSSMEATTLRNEKVKVLSALRPIAIRDTVRGQYQGYREAPGVSPASDTPTYAALKLYVDNWRWQDVPFYLRSGKALARKASEIVVQFRRPPRLFEELPRARRSDPPNILSLCIQPDEGIHLQFQAKVPDSLSEMRHVDMTFHYADSFDDRAIPEAYERLLMDALGGDASLFTREDEVMLSWRLIDSVLQGWQMADAPPLATYVKGSWGPDAADALLAGEDRVWRVACGDHD